MKFIFLFIASGKSFSKKRIKSIKHTIEMLGMPDGIKYWAYDAIKMSDAKLKYVLKDLGLSASLRVQHIADQVLWNDDDELEDTPDYSLCHFSIRKAFLKHFEIQLGVDNIGDVRLADKSDLFDYEERGRFYYANLRTSF